MTMMFMSYAPAAPLLLVAESTAEHRQLAEFLSDAGCSLTWVHRSSDALPVLANLDTGAVILDSGNNLLASLELCFSIKSAHQHRNLRVIILGHSNESREEIAAFDAGADDFIRRPLDPEIVFKRLRARLDYPANGRAQFANSKDNLIIDREAYAVYLNQQPVPVSRKEFELLHLMAAQPGKVFTREEIFEKVWKRKPSQNDRTIDVHILRLRRKLGSDFITTQKGIGYRFMQA